MSDGSIRNAYTVHLLNKRPEISAVALAVEGLPAAEVHAVGPDSAVPGMPLIMVGPDQTREIRVLVTVPATAKIDASTPLTVRATDSATGETAVAADHFIAR